MRVTRWWLLGALLLLILIQTAGSVAAQPSAKGSPSSGLQPVDCITIIEQLTQEPDWLSQLSDPVISDQQELLNRLARDIPAYECLSSGDEPLSADLRAATAYLEYFLIFTLGQDTPAESSYLKLVDLATSDDPAVVKLRDEAGLPPPPGLVFVRFYNSRQAMPPRLQGLFSEDVAGLTLLTRYIAILEEDPYTFEQQALQSQTLPKTISHELIHAYVNASLGVKALGDLPRWFSEGIAIYFSNSGEDHIIVGPDATVRTTSPQDYREYRDNIKFLENKLGSERLLNVIRISIEQNDPRIIYRDLGYTSDEEFIQSANDYWTRRLLLAAGGVSAGVLLIIWWMLRLMPEVRCRHCRYAGKKGEFANGYCPNCAHPYPS
jgi:hypothetical protein